MKKTSLKLSFFIVAVFSFIVILNKQVYAQDSEGGSYGTPSTFWGTSEGWSECKPVTASGSSGCYQYKVQQYYVFWFKVGSEKPVRDGSISNNQRACACP